MDGWMDGGNDGWVGGLMDGSGDVCREGWVGGLILIGPFVHGGNLSLKSLKK